MYYLYILFSKKDKTLYVGITQDLKRRVQKHFQGFVRSTKNRRPLVLIHYEAYLRKSDALRREKFLKGGKGREELKIQLYSILSELEYKYIKNSPQNLPA